MKGVQIYQPPSRTAPIHKFLDSLEPKFREKLIWRIFWLSGTPRASLREPHYKHFGLERYNGLYEVRERGKVLVRIIFTYSGNDVLLLNAFIKRKPRDTMQALEQSLRILAELQEHPEYAVEFRVKEEKIV